jgi:REP-associated tyrosine transposase
VPRGLKRYQQARESHFITFSCYRRQPLLDTPQARRVFEQTLERVRRWYDFYVVGYVVMPEHVHLLLSEPERSTLAVAVQMLKQIVAHEVLPTLSPKSGDKGGAPPSPKHFWQTRYYDFNVWTAQKRIEKLRYIHRNPVARGLAAKPEDWAWSSFRHYQTGTEGVVEIESEWTGRRRERMGLAPLVKIVPTLSPKEGDKDGAPTGLQITIQPRHSRGVYRSPGSAASSSAKAR